VREWVTERRPDVTVEVHQGGQPLYPYFVGLE
jgi:dihydroxyacetone kinase-like predicted kinase